MKVRATETVQKEVEISDMEAISIMLKVLYAAVKPPHALEDLRVTGDGELEWVRVERYGAHSSIERDVIGEATELQKAALMVMKAVRDKFGSVEFDRAVRRQYER